MESKPLGKYINMENYSNFHQKFIKRNLHILNGKECRSVMGYQQSQNVLKAIQNLNFELELTHDIIKSYKQEE